MFVIFKKYFVCTFILIRTGYLHITGTDEISSTSIFGAILLFGGIQSLILGILAVYIGAILKETKKRPLYIIDKTYGFESSIFPFFDGRLWLTGFLHGLLTRQDVPFALSH